MATLTQSATNKYWSYALWLASFTIFYNLAYFSYYEGRESFEKAAGLEDCCAQEE